MKFAIALFSAAHAPSSRRALLFAQAALAGGHEIVRLFFYQDGVHSASQLRHEHPTDGRAHAAEAKHRTHHVLGRVVHYQAPDVCGPGKVRTDGQGDCEHCDPQTAGACGQDNAKAEACEQIGTAHV